MKFPRVIVLALAVCLSGCFDINDELQLNADGSGTVRLETKLAFSPESMDGLRAMAANDSESGPSIYPPFRKGEVSKFFPSKDFTTTVTEETPAEGESVLKIEAHFKDINALLASPYGRAHALSIHIDGGKLNVGALSGAELLGRLAAGTNGYQTMFPNMPDLQKKKDKMRARFRIVLPEDAHADGKEGAVEGKSVTWVFERSRSNDDDAFARHLARPLSAGCAAEKLTFKPSTPLRLNLKPFSELTAHSAHGAAPIQDRSAVMKAAKFTPSALSVERSVDLSGDAGSVRQNNAELQGLLEVPPEFAPQKWGKVDLQEAIDCEGNSLKPQTDARSHGYSRFSSVHVGGERSSPATSKLAHQHLVKIPFQPPPWKCQQIDRVLATVDLHYASGLRLLKISNAVPAKWIRTDEDFDASEMRIDSPELREAGLSLRLQMAMVQNGNTMLMLNTAESKTSISDLQIFDADGAPWPTLMQQTPGGDDDEGRYMILPGRPKPPLSAALLVNSSESSVRVPIQADNLALRGEAPPERKAALGPLDARYAQQRRARYGAEDPGADLPVTDAGPGFLTEALGMRVTTAALLPGAAKSPPENPHAFIHRGAVVSAKLFAPRGRTLRSISGTRALRAVDDKGRKMNVETASEEDFSPAFTSLPANAVSGNFELRLPVPPADAEAIEELAGEVLATTAGTWKETVLTNLAENTNHDLSTLLPGASLLLKKVTSKNRQITIEAEIKGPKGIRQLDLQCKIAGLKNVNSHSSDRQSTDTSRSIHLMVYAFGSQEDIPLESVSLSARIPQDIRRERVPFVLRGLDLF